MKDLDTQIAKELTLKALEQGGNSTGLPYQFDNSAEKIGDFVGGIYTRILEKVTQANGSEPKKKDA